MSKPTFGYTAVTAEQSEIIDLLNDHFETLESRILRHVPVGRRQSLALTNLEQAAMCAVKAVAKDGPEAEQRGDDLPGHDDGADDPCDAGLNSNDAENRWATSPIERTIAAQRALTDAMQAGWTQRALTDAMQAGWTQRALTDAMQAGWRQTLSAEEIEQRRQMATQSDGVDVFKYAIGCGDACADCGHALKDNQHGFDQNDGYLDENDKLVHSGRCTYCIYCREGFQAPYVPEPEIGA